MDRERDMSIGDVWRTAGRNFRAICLILPMLGILAVALGIYGDAHRFWITRPFLTNVASGLTGAFFGIPFTLLVLGWLTGSQARREQKRAVSDFACSSAKAFRDSVFEIVTPRLRHDMWVIARLQNLAHCASITDMMPMGGRRKRSRAVRSSVALPAATPRPRPRSCYGAAPCVRVR